MTPMADLSSLGPRDDAGMGLGWLAGPGAVLEYGVSVLAGCPSESRSAWIPAGRRSVRRSMVFTWCCHHVWADSAQSLRPGLNAGGKPHTPRRPLGWAAGKGVPILEHHRRVCDSALSGNTTWSAVSERWIRVYENRIGSGWESPPCDEPKPVCPSRFGSTVPLFFSFHAEDGWEMVTPNCRERNEVFWREKKSFQGACRKTMDRGRACIRNRPSGPGDVGDGRQPRRSPRFSRSRAERGGQHHPSGIG